MAYSPNLLQLTHVLQQLYRRLGGKVTKATGGTNATVIDTKLTDELADGNQDDLFNGGTLLVVKDAAGLAAAPEGEISRVVDYAADTQTLSLSPALSAGVDAGDTIIIAPPDFPLYDMVEVVNDALRYLGEIPVPDVSLVTASEQTEYTLPAGMIGRQLLNLELQTVLGDADNNQFVPIEGYSIVPPSVAGGAGTLVLPASSAGYIVRVTYLGVHPRVEAYDGNISRYFHPDLVHAAVFAHAIQWRNDQNAIAGGADDASLRLEQKAWSQFDRARIQHPVTIPPRRIQGMPHFNAGGDVRLGLYPPYSIYG